MLKIVVLGGAAGGGVPQWNCACPTCKAAWSDPALQDGQTSIAVSADGAHWFLVNASPDIRQQIIATPDLHPRPGALRHSPIAGVILTNGEVDAVAGLLSLREGSPFGLYAHKRVIDLLDANSIFNVLDRTLVPRRPIEIGAAFAPALPDGTPSGLVVEAFEVPGKSAWYLEGTARGHERDVPGDTLGLHIRAADDSGPGIYFVAACGGVDAQLAERLSGADLVFFDGTLWTDDEIIRTGLGRKTGQRMGHISMSGAAGAMAALDGLGIGRRIFIHVNNSNPALLPRAPERQTLETAGWELARAGERIDL
ncbi:MAG: pyrroloquinoline quinone biosynthesis protein PqqB [Rhodobacteraceae bacterium]|nr:pyrroloquinoline quinone biosynthesis protein PqqB [Paracoccaceae bacterium]